MTTNATLPLTYQVMTENELDRAMRRAEVDDGQAQARAIRMARRPDRRWPDMAPMASRRTRRRLDRWRARRHQHVREGDENVIWQVCVRCSALFRDRQRRNLCFGCWCDRNPTPTTVNIANYRPGREVKR
jgi:hypothetical protein